VIQELFQLSLSNPAQIRELLKDVNDQCAK